MMQTSWYPQYPAYGYGNMNQYSQWPMMPQGGPGMPMGAYMPQTPPFFNYYPEPYTGNYMVPTFGAGPSGSAKEETKAGAADTGEAQEQPKKVADEQPEKEAEEESKTEAEEESETEDEEESDSQDEEQPKDEAEGPKQEQDE
jgi:hypothetical protein